MSPELDAVLCERYPKIFANRYKSMQETCMCWGFECGDGWYSILSNACMLIQARVNHLVERRARIIERNEAKAAYYAGDNSKMYAYFRVKDTANISPWTAERIALLACEKEEEVPPEVSQFVAVQVKEKFGTLRFYYTGGDDVTDGIVRMAEAMSAVTCEVCGNPGTSNGEGWLRTLCEAHKE